MQHDLGGCRGKCGERSNGNFEVLLGRELGEPSRLIPIGAGVRSMVLNNLEIKGKFNGCLYEPRSSISGVHQPGGSQMGQEGREKMVLGKISKARVVEPRFRMCE